MNFIKLPVVLIDQDYEHFKREHGTTPTEFSAEYVVGTLEITSNAHLIKIEDSWFPTLDHFRMAQDGDFTTCSATFEGIGTYEIAMSKERFKEYFLKQKQKIAENEPKVEIFNISAEEFRDLFLKQKPNTDEEDTKSDTGGNV